MYILSEDLPCRTLIRTERTQTGSFFPSLIVKAIAVPISPGQLKKLISGQKGAESPLLAGSCPLQPDHGQVIAGGLLPAPCRDLAGKLPVKTELFRRQSCAQNLPGAQQYMCTLFVCQSNNVPQLRTLFSSRAHCMSTPDFSLPVSHPRPGIDRAGFRTGPFSQKGFQPAAIWAMTVITGRVAIMRILLRAMSWEASFASQP